MTNLMICENLDLLSLCVPPKFPLVTTIQNEIPSRPMNSAIPPGNFEILSRLKKLDLCGLKKKLNNILYQVVIQSKKNPHKSNLFKRESISKLPGGMSLFVFLIPSDITGSI